MATERTTSLGRWDRIVGPGAGLAENVGTVGLGLVGAAVAPGLRRGSSPPSDRRAEVLAPGVLRVLALDLWGGAWCNNTPAAARWYHRRGRGRAQHLVFAAAHVHPFIVAWLDRGDGRSRVVWALGQYGYLMVATAFLAGRDRRTQRAAALALTAGGVLLDRFLGTSPSAPWFGPVYYLKLLAGHVGGAAALPRDPLSGRSS